MTRASTRKALPKSVYVARLYSDSGKESWLSAETDVTQLGELGEVILVGRYELVEISRLNGIPLLGGTVKVKP